MDIQIIDRNEEILDPNMPVLEKIGRMARLCYKVEGEGPEGRDERIVKKCVADGHESILEHGVASVFLNSEITDAVKKFCETFGLKQAYSLNTLWSISPTDAMNKYIEPFVDPELFGRFHEMIGEPTEEKKILQCMVGDIRAWRQVIRERIFFATQQSDQIQFVLTLKILNELNKIDGGKVLFADIVTHMNDLLKDENVRKRMLTENCKLLITQDGEKEGEQYTVKSVMDFYFSEKNMVIAGQAAACASLSLIITTDRATTHQLVRHRKNVAYSQESQRYVNYNKKGYRAIALTVDPEKAPEGIKVDHDTGKVAETEPAYEVWKKALEVAFTAYEKILETGIPSESARGVLPNDTATTIGVTWMRTASFINFNFWRLEKHAQFAIRAMAYRILIKMFEMNHPFGETIPYDTANGWLKQMIDYKMLADDTPVKAVMAHRDQVHKVVVDFLKKAAEQAKQQKAAKK